MKRSVFWSVLGNSQIDGFMRDRWDKRLCSRLGVVGLAKEQGGSVLDCGFGSGPFYDLFKDTNLDYIGLDSERKFVKSCHKRFPSNGWRFILGDILNIPFAGESFSTVFCSSVLEHLPPGFYKKAINEMARVAKKQVILDFYRVLIEQETRIHWSTNQYWDNQYNRDEIVSSLQISGIKNISFFTVNMGEGFTDHEIMRGLKNG